MKKIILVNDNFIFGGTNTAILPIINLILKNNFEITLWIVSGVYDVELIKRIPNNVNVIFGKKESLKGKFSKLHYRVKKNVLNPTNMLNKFKNKQRVNPFIPTGNIMKKLSQNHTLLNDHFDIAFYFDVEITNYYLKSIEKQVRASKNYLWVHTDYSNGVIKKRFNINKEVSTNTLKRFNEILAVSENAKYGLLKELKNTNSIRTITLPLDIDWVLKQSKKKVTEMNKERICVLSVARLSEIKGIDRAIRVHRRLKDEGFSFYWYVIGDGELKSELKILIKESKLENDFFLLGKKDNPFAYMKNADILALVSRSESYGIVVDEANLLGIPVLATNVGGIKSIITDKEDGIIVENSELAIFNGLKEMILSKEMRDSFADYQNLKERISKRENNSNLMSLFD